MIGWNFLGYIFLDIRIWKHTQDGLYGERCEKGLKSTKTMDYTPCIFVQKPPKMIWFWKYAWNWLDEGRCENSMKALDILHGFWFKNHPKWNDFENTHGDGLDEERCVKNIDNKLY